MQKIAGVTRYASSGYVSSEFFKAVFAFISASALSVSAACGGSAGDDEDSGVHESGIEYTADSFIDPRDHNIYKTVSFKMSGGGSLTIMAENMRYTGTSAAPITYQYPNGDSTNNAVYGLLYDWETASEHVCPAGWHLPSEAEVMQFVQYVDAHKASRSLFDALTARSTAWACYAKRSTDEAGLGILPAGKWDPESAAGGSSFFVYFRTAACFWTSSPGESGRYKSWMLNTTGKPNACGDSSQDFMWWNDSPVDALSVRCVK